MPAPQGNIDAAGAADPVVSGRAAQLSAAPTDADLVEIFRLMCTVRALEERLIVLYRQAKIPGGMYLGVGSEAISVASAYCLEERDILCPFTRDVGARLAKGTSPTTLLRGYLGRVTGPMRGRDGNVHQGDPEHNILAMTSLLGAMIPLVVGAVHAENMRGGNVIGMTYIGDGATSTGDFHEAINFAAVWKNPLVLLIEDNQYAYSTPTRDQFACKTLADRAVGYGIPGVTVDGTDALAVYAEARKAVDRARAGEGPSIIECKTLRMRGHGEHDDNAYVPPALLARWQAKDPLDRLARVLHEREVLDAAATAEVRAQAAREIGKVAELVEAEPLPSPDDVLEGGGALAPDEPA